MSRSGMTRGRVVRIGVAATALTAVLVLAIATASASAEPKPAPDFGKGEYLALGDSVAFGYVPPQAVPAPDYDHAKTFVGYPEVLANELGEKIANASCPGETTASMLTPGAQSNGCENSVGSSTGYRTLFPLHVQYKGTQTAYAIDYLAHHKHVNLVTIDIGANDAFVCQETTADHCTSPAELGALAAEIQHNLGSVFEQIRDVAGYQGSLVALSYYSLNYADPTQVAAAQLLNSIIAGVTTQFGGIVADGFGAFQAGSAASGGDPCAAGLLIKLPDGTCNIHPSPEGHELLADAIATAIGA